MKFLRIFGIFAILAGANFGFAFGEPYYTFTLNDQGGTGGRVYENFTGALDLGTAFGYLDNGGKFYSLSEIDTIPTPPANSYSHFRGYYTEPNGQGKVIVTTQGHFSTSEDALMSITANGTQIYANWAPNFYRITLDDGEGSGGQAASSNFFGLFERYSSCYFLASILNNTELENAACAQQIYQAPTRTGYNFDGYYTGTNGTGVRIVNSNKDIVGPNTQFTSDSTIYAKWTPKVFTVTLNHQSPTNSPAPSTVYLKYATNWYSNPAATTPISSMTTVPTKTNYDFGGYWTGTNGSGIQVINSNGNFLTTQEVLTAITSNTMIYAKWTAAAPAVYTVTLNSNGGSGNHAIYYSNGNYYCDSSATRVINSNANVFTTCDFSAPTLTNNNFNGYYSNASNGTQYVGTDGKLTIAARSMNINTNTTWYAQYVPATQPIKCDCGYYLPANSTECVQCPIGSYCAAGIWQAPLNYDQGVADCGKSCSGATSAAGACSVEQCYQTCTTPCYKPNELCPGADQTACEYITFNVSGIKYLQSDGSCGTVCEYADQPANSAPNWCPVETCPANYYFLYSDKTCKACDNGFSAPAGSTSPQQCVKDCSVACSWNASVCPAHATCTPDMTSNPNNGVVNQTQSPNACFDKETGQQLTPNACDFTFACVTGYQTNELHDACEAKKYTVTYVCGDGATGSSVTDNNATYDANYTVLDNTTCVNIGHDFSGWVFSGNSNPYSAGDQFTWTYDDNTLTFIAQWGQPKTYQITYELNGGNWGDATCPGTGCPNSYTYGASDVIIDVQPVRALSVFEGWCTDSTLPTCASSQTIPANTTGNKTFYAKWRCIEPYHESTDHKSCEACLDDYYWNSATGQCLRCEDADSNFPHSTRPFNWSVDQCWRSCENNASCQLAPASVIQNMNATCTATSFMSSAGTQIEFKGNAGSVTTCDATNVPYCPYGFECSAENVEMPRTAPVTFHWGNNLSNSALRHVVGLGRITATGPIMTQGKMWSAIMGPAQQVEFQAAYDAYTFITYPTNAAPDASFAGHTFVGYYDAQTAGNQHVADTGLLNGTNAQSVGVTLDNEIPGNRDLYAHYDESGYDITYVMNGGEWPSGSNCPGVSGCPTTYTHGTGATINAVPTRDHSVFEAWCTDPDLNPNSCNMTQIIGPTETGNKTFYAKWKCLEPYHSNSAGTACEACGNNTYYNPESPTLCDPCPSSFPYSRTPFNWSEDQCYRDCPDGSMCQADANVGAGFPTGCNFTTFSNSGKQVEFKGNVGHVNTCGVVTYCPYGTYGCGIAEAFKPMSAPVDFYGRGNTATPVDTYYIFGSRDPNSIDLGTGNIWSQIVGPAQQGTLNHNTIGGVPVDYRYTYMFYPVYTAPNADIPGYTFNGYYYPENNGTRYVQSSYALNSTNAQDVVDDVPGDWNTARPLYATLTNGGYTPIDYTITYDCGTATGGSAPEQQTGIHYGVSVTPRENTCVNAGYTFLGWMVSGTSDIRQPGESFTWEYEESKTFTAKWSGGNSYTITYKPNYTGATEADQTQDVVYGGAFTTKPAGTFHRDGYQMTAWSEPFQILNHPYNYNVANDTTLNAQWEICAANTYSNGVICDNCPPEYPLSAQGSTIDGCYHNCETPCVEPATCPIEHATCTYGANSNPGQWYYNASACNAPALTCPVASFVCDEGYTQNGDHCEPCPAGTYWENGQCVPCPEGTTSNPGSVGSESCVPLCPNPNQHFIHGNCEDNVVSCTAPHATTATRTWNATLRAYGSCQIVECESGYHIASNACVPDEQLCNIPNGRGERAWNGTTWGTCEVTQCDPGFEQSGNECIRCSNFLGSDGQPAVSSYTSGCDIATCMYQGQKYILRNNECDPICNKPDDETGHMEWNESLKKCVRTCNPGYKMW